MRSPSLFAVIVLLAGKSLAAQDTERTVALTVSPSFVHFEEFGGGFGAAVARLSVSRAFTRLTGAEVSAFTLALLGGADDQPLCVAGSTCESRSTPSLLSGLLMSVFGYLGESGLRASVGVGAVGASGGEGLGNRSSFAGIVGLDWISRSNNRFAATVAFRLVQLASPIAGARVVLLPGVGISF